MLEIGAATGFNSALLASLTGPGGKVVTIEYDPGLAGQAAANLRRAGYPQVQVITGDGALGHREQPPTTASSSPPRQPTSPPPGGTSSTPPTAASWLPSACTAAD